MPNYTRLKEMCVRQINKSGRSITLVQLDNSNPVAGRNWQTVSDPRAAPLASVVTKGVTISSDEIYSLGIAFEDMDFLKRSHQFIMIAPNDTLDVEKADEIIDGTKRLGIDKVEKLQPGDTTLLYFVRVKQ